MFNGKKISIFLILSLLMLMVACGQKTTSNQSEVQQGGDQQTVNVQDPYNLRISHTVPETGSTHIGLEMFKELVEERSEGQIVVDIFPNGQLYASEREALEAVQIGNIEMTVTASAPVAGFVSQFYVLDLPFLFPDHETAYEALDGELGQQLLDLLPEIGLRGLGYGETGMRHITNNRHPIESVADLERLKIRTMENQVHIRAFNSLGATAEPFAFGELYSALQQNVFDGMENPLNLIDQMKFYEVQDYLTITNHAYTATIYFMNDNFYTSLPENLQQVLKESAQEAVTYQRSLARQQDDEGLEVIKNAMEINTLSPEQRQEFIDALEPLYQEFEESIGSELLELAKSYR